MPLGAVVATCTLVDCVPMVDRIPRILDRGPDPCDDPTSTWLLEDVEPVDPPISVRGRQGLWNWEQAA